MKKIMTIALIALIALMATGCIQQPAMKEDSKDNIEAEVLNDNEVEVGLFNSLLKIDTRTIINVSDGGTVKLNESGV